MKRIVKHNGTYRGSLMTFQHYLNLYHSFLPFEVDNDGGSQLYKITEWYTNGILTKVLIERDTKFRESPIHYLNSQKRDIK